MKSKQKPLLADKIADILTSAPRQSDPETESDPDTTAKVIEENYIDEDNTEEQLFSKFRKQNVDLLADIDEKYAGKKASRKSLRESDGSSSDNEKALSAESEIEGPDPGNDDIEHHSDEDDESVEEEEDTDENEQDSEIEEEEYDETEDTFNHMTDSDVSMQLKKGLSVKNQLNVWENLLEMRIQLQKCLVAANKMPPSHKFKDIKKEMGKEFSEKISETKTNVGNLLGKLLLLQNLVQKKYPETKKLGRKNEKESVPPEDEEIPSDTDDEVENLSGDNEDEEEKPVPKKRKLTSDYERDISENFKLYKPYRNEVIQKWHEKTRLIVMKSNSASQSIVDHIEHTLSDRAKLVKRTQLRRSDYNIIGEDTENQNAVNEEDNSRINQIYNKEIFDDDDFYHQLLRELIEMKSADLTDPVQLGRQWIQLQNLRSKMKRKIDTKATKGRKIRYTVHTKLVNFMAPFDENSWTDQAKNELFSSLFGKKQLTGS